MHADGSAPVALRHESALSGRPLGSRAQHLRRPFRHLSRRLGGGGQSASRPPHAGGTRALVTRAGAPWGDAFELAVNFEINRPDAGGRYRRPYVAVWVEDKDGFPVRNLLLWVSQGGAGPFDPGR